MKRDQVLARFKTQTKGNKEVEYAQAMSYLQHMFETRHKAFHFMLIINVALLAVQFNSKATITSIEKLIVSVFGFLITALLLGFARRNATANAKIQIEVIKIEEQLGYSLLSSSHYSKIKGPHSGIYLTSIYVICMIIWAVYGFITF